MALRKAPKYAKIGEIPSLFVEEALPSGVKRIKPKAVAIASSSEDTHPWRNWYAGAWKSCMTVLSKHHNCTQDTPLGKFNACVVYGVVKNNEFKPSDTTACFANIVSSGVGIRYVLSFLMNYDDSDNQRFYLDWLVNRSPWSKVFPEKDINIIRDNGLIADANYPSNLVVGGLIASRAFREEPNSIPVFKSLCDQGVVPNLAYILSLLAYCGGDKTRIRWSKDATGHSAVSQKNFDIITLGNFINARTDPKRTRKKLSEDPRYYVYGEEGKIFDIWGKEKGKNLAMFIASEYKYGEDKQKSANPFAKAEAVEYDVYDVAISKMAALSHKLMALIEGEEDK